MNRVKTTRYLAIFSAILLLGVIAFMVITSLFHLLTRGRFLMDYLLPGELFPLVLIGGVLTVIASFLVNYQKLLTTLLFAATLLSLGIALWYAQVSGLAQGTIGMDTMQFEVVRALLILYDLGAFVLGLKALTIIRQLKLQPR